MIVERDVSGVEQPTAPDFQQPDLSGIEADLAEIQRCQDAMARYQRDLADALRYGYIEPLAPNC